MKRIALVFSLTLLLGAGCLGVPASSSFSVGDWRMVGFETEATGLLDVSNQNFTLTLGEDDFMGAIICNDMGGDYTIEGGTLMVPELATTLKFCEGVAGDVETVFMTDVANGLVIEGEGDELILVGDSGARFTYERSAGDAEDLGLETRAVAGNVTAVDLDAIAYDGPAVVTIESDDGAMHEIHVPSFGLTLCDASEQIADVFAIEVGDAVEVMGEVNEDGTIVPCASAEHYLRVTN